MPFEAAPFSGTRGAGTGRRQHALQGALVGGEVAACLVLLVGAGLLLRSFVALQRVEPGFDAERVLTFQLSLPRAAYPRVEEQVRPFWGGLLDRVRVLPGVRAAAVTSNVPLTSPPYVTFDVAGREAQPGEDVQPFTVSGGYFRAMGVPLVRGRTFTDASFGTDHAWRYVTYLTVGYMISRGLAKAGSREPQDG